MLLIQINFINNFYLVSYFNNLGSRVNLQDKFLLYTTYICFIKIKRKYFYDFFQLKILANKKIF